MANFLYLYSKTFNNITGDINAGSRLILFSNIGTADGSIEFKDDDDNGCGTITLPAGQSLNLSESIDNTLYGKITVTATGTIIQIQSNIDIR